MTDKNDNKFSNTTRIIGASAVVAIGVGTVIAARRAPLSRIRMMEHFGPTGHMSSFHQIPYRINGISDVYDVKTWSKILKPGAIPQFVTGVENELKHRGLQPHVDLISSPILSYGRYGPTLGTIDGSRTYFVATPASLITDPLSNPRASYGLKIEVEKAARGYASFNMCLNTLLNAGVVYGALSCATDFSGLMFYGPILYTLKNGVMRQLEQQQNRIAEDRVIPTATTHELEAAFVTEAGDALAQMKAAPNHSGEALIGSVHRFFSKEPKPLERAVKLSDELKKRPQSITVKQVLRTH